MGFKGDIGLPGQHGLTGLLGLRGEKGIRGLDGRNGIDAEDGSQGDRVNKIIDSLSGDASFSHLRFIVVCCRERLEKLVKMEKKETLV